MNRLFFVTIVIGAFALVQGCRKNIDNLIVTEKGAIPFEGVQSSLYGRVVNADGAAVKGAYVWLENNTFVETDSLGVFYFTNNLLNKNGAKVLVQKEGFFETVRYAFPKLGGNAYMEIQLIPKNLTTTFSGSDGATFSIGNGGKVTIPANGVIDVVSGSGYSGPVNVYAVYLDPTEDKTFQIMPGDLRAIDSAGYAKVLKSFGMIGVELEKPNGQKLQMGPGQKAKISMEVPSQLADKAPATIPLWHFDPISGYWQEQSSATLVNGTYEGEVTHFSFWNCDWPVDYVIITGRVLNTNGQPMASALVKVNSSTIYGQRAGFTDFDGYYGGLMPSNEILTFKVVKYCNDQVLFENDFGPFATNATVPDIQVDGQSDTKTVTGHLTDCNNLPLANGLIRVTSIDHTYNFLGISNEQGDFSMAITDCSGQQDFELRAINTSSPLTSLQYDIHFTDNTVDLGDVAVCTQPDEYVNGTVNGSTFMTYYNVNFSYTAGEGYIYSSGSGLTDSTTINVSILNYDPVTMEAEVGHVIITKKELSQYQYNSCYYCNDIGCNCTPSMVEKVKFTSFPTAPGEYAEGTLSGSIKNLQGEILPFNIAFRIRQ